MRTSAARDSGEANWLLLLLWLGGPWAHMWRRVCHPRHASARAAWPGTAANTNASNRASGAARVAGWAGAGERVEEELANVPWRCSPLKGGGRWRVPSAASCRCRSCPPTSLVAQVTWTPPQLAQPAKGRAETVHGVAAAHPLAAQRQRRRPRRNSAFARPRAVRVRALDHQLLCGVADDDRVARLVKSAHGVRREDGAGRRPTPARGQPGPRRTGCSPAADARPRLPREGRPGPDAAPGPRPSGRGPVTATHLPPWAGPAAPSRPGP